jgi:hypothetical protein
MASHCGPTQKKKRKLVERKLGKKEKLKSQQYCTIMLLLKMMIISL